MNNYFATNLQYLRKKKGISQEEVAEDLNVPRSTYTCWETGIRTPKIEQIQDIANYFGVGMEIITRDYSQEYTEDNIEEMLNNSILDNVKLCTEDEKRQILQIIEVIRKDNK